MVEGFGRLWLRGLEISGIGFQDQAHGLWA